MTIIVKALSGTALEVVSGRRRLQATLDVVGKATVQVAETGETLEVHEVDGEIVVLKDPAAAAAETIAAHALERAAR